MGHVGRGVAAFVLATVIGALSGCVGLIEGDVPVRRNPPLGGSDGGGGGDAGPPPVPCEGEGAVQPTDDLCAALNAAEDGATLRVCPGTHVLACAVVANGDNITVLGEEGSVLEGSLSCTRCDGWLFDGLHIRGAGTNSGTVAQMLGGLGWRWTRADISNADHPAVYGLFSVGATEAAGIPTAWTIDQSYFHDNGNAVGNNGGVPHEGNQDHLMYVISESTTDLQATLEDNVFVNARWGDALKIGGTGTKSWPTEYEGSSGITVRRNVFVNHALFDGAGLVLLTTGSSNLTLEDNVIATFSSDAPGEYVSMGTWYGTGITLRDNTYAGWVEPNPILGVGPVSPLVGTGGRYYAPNDCGTWALCEGNLAGDAVPAPDSLSNPSPAPWQ